MFPLARQNKLTVRELPDETLVYDLERHKAHCLNRTSALVWKHCDGKTSLAQIAAVLAKELHVPDATPVAELALEQLSKRALLEPETAVSGPCCRLTRREALKRVAVAAAALPLVMSIASPAAAQAVSYGRLLSLCYGRSCNPASPSDCPSPCRCIALDPNEPDIGTCVV